MYFPWWLGDEGRKRKPVVEFVFLEISKGDEKETRECL
jgi:hypothetical protein